MARLLRASEQWFQLLLRLYPADFREELGDAVVRTYCERARLTLARGGLVPFAGLWIRALADALRNGPGERLWPAAAWRRSGNGGATSSSPVAVCCDPRCSSPPRSAR